jgi:hypothetical protein
MRPFLAGANARNQCTGEKISLQQDSETFFKKNGPLRKFGVLPS